MRLLHIHSGNLYGGVEVVLHTLARCRSLCPAMQPEFALCFDGRVAAELRAAGAPVHILGKVRARNPHQVIQVRRRLSDLLRFGAFDAAVCHMLWPLAIFGPAVRRAGLPLVFWMHDAMQRFDWLQFWAGFASPDLVLCNSRFTAATRDHYFKKRPCLVVRYPIASRPRPQAADRDALRVGFDTPHDAVVIVQASRMEAWKGHRVLLEGLAALKEIPRWVCWIAGGPQRSHEIAYERALRTKAAELGISKRVRFLGQRSDVTRLFAAADIYCQPNLGAEPFGIVFVEAMQAGLPAVATAAGGPLEILDDSCGRLVPPDSPCALAETLETLIADDGQRHGLGRGGRRRAAQLCDPRRQLQRLHTIVQELIATVHARRAGACESEAFGPPTSVQDGAGRQGTNHLSAFSSDASPLSAAGFRPDR
jgi:glycosyltransferase involved in cell wall biosynthesis